MPALLPATLIVASLLQGCSWEGLQRTGYETLESMRVQQCLDRLDGECGQQRIPYNDYQSERKQLNGQ